MSEPSQPSISVMTSSSLRDLRDLIHEVTLIGGVEQFDLMLIRDVDLIQAKIYDECTPLKRMASIVRDDGFMKKIAEWFELQTKDLHLKIPALATYFPDVSSVHECRRQEAVDAIVNCIRFAFELRQVSVPIVEIVCGTIIEPAEWNNGQPSARVNEYHLDHKMDQLFTSLHDVVTRVADEHGNDRQWALALEMEPGETYLLNGLEAMQAVAERLDGTRPLPKEVPKDALRSLQLHVGYNIDIAHMRIAGVEADQLSEFRDRIVHAHIADHPGMHTHDQPLGSWTNVVRYDGGYVPYLGLLMERLDNSTDLPFSGAVAIELEGRNDIMAIQHSITALRMAIELAQRHKSRGNYAARFSV
jgi:hypothetical protein